jgi:hypothetical protein
MKQEEAIQLLRTEKEIVALDTQSCQMFLALGLAMLYQGEYPIAKVTLSQAVRHD